MYILLAHEFAHWYDFHTRTGKWKQGLLPHGERFQRILWGLIPRPLWARASREHWVSSSSAHRPEFQPDLCHALDLLEGAHATETQQAA